MSDFFDFSFEHLRKYYENVLFLPNIKRMEENKVKIPKFFKDFCNLFEINEETKILKPKEKYEKFWYSREELRKKGITCSCEDSVVDFNDLCIRCLLKNNNPKWKFSYNDFPNRFLCYSIELKNKAVKFKFEGKEGVEILIDNHLEVWQLFRWYFWAKQNKKCFYCKKVINFYEGNYAELHHIKPRCVGGLESEDNLIFLCKQCHRKKRGEVHKFKEFFAQED